MLYIFMKVAKNPLNEIQKDSKEDPSGKVKIYNMTFLIPSTRAEVPGGACVMVRVS